MDRAIVYPGEVPADTNVLQPQVNAMVALGNLTGAVLGASTYLSGLQVTPTTPASLGVIVAPGSITQLSTIDANAFGSIPANSAPLVKTGIIETATTIAITAPATTGQSINYLVEASFLEVDDAPIALPYYNAANPSQPFTGSAGSGTAQNTQRQQLCSLQLKAGVAAATGSQTTPSADAGWSPLAIVTVNAGQTTITAANIVQHPAAPYLTPYTASHHYGLPGTAPQVHLNSEVQGILPGNMVQAGYFATAGFYDTMNLLAFGATGATQSWTVPANVYRVRVTMVGGGGGGGWGTATYGGGGGGAGGGLIGVAAVTPGQVIAITPGLGGAGGILNGAGAQTGGTSSFGSIFTATGGFGGASSTQFAFGGGPGQASGQSLNILGGYGSDGNANTVCYPAAGGASLFGGSGRGGIGGGVGGQAYGSGGGGCYYAAGNGGSGQSGVVVLAW